MCNRSFLLRYPHVCIVADILERTHTIRLLDLGENQLGKAQCSKLGQVTTKPKTNPSN